MKRAVKEALKTITDELQSTEHKHADDTSFVGAKDVYDMDKALFNYSYRRFRKWIVDNDIERRSPRKNRLQIHAGDYLRCRTASVAKGKLRENRRKTEEEYLEIVDAVAAMPIDELNKFMTSVSKDARSLLFTIMKTRRK